jgi:hypothetical protein
VRKRIVAEQAQLRWEARIVSIAPFIMLAIFRFSAPGLVAPFYATPAGAITILLAGLVSIASRVLVMRMGNRPLQIVESAFVATEIGMRGDRYGSSPRSEAPLSNVLLLPNTCERGSAFRHPLARLVAGRDDHWFPTTRGR